MDRLKQGGAPEEVITQLANQLTSKLLHQPTRQLKSGDDELLKSVADLYQLDDGSRE